MEGGDLDSVSFTDRKFRGSDTRKQFRKGPLVEFTLISHGPVPEW